MKIKTLKSLKPGDKLKFTKEHKEFWAKEAWAMCIPRGGASSKEHVSDYFIRKAISLSLPYHAEFVEYRSDVGDNKPGALVKISVGNLYDITLVDHTEIIKVK